MPLGLGFSSTHLLVSVMFLLRQKNLVSAFLQNNTSNTLSFRSLPQYSKRWVALGNMRFQTD